MGNEQRNHFAFFRSYLETIDQCPEDAQLALFKAIARYGLNSEEPDFSGMNNCGFLKAIWFSILPVISRSIARQQSPGAPLGNHNSPNGRRGKGIEQGASSDHNEAEETEPTNVGRPEEKDQSKPATAKKARKTFTPPTEEEVTKYAKERGFKDPLGFASHFIAYYSQGESPWHLSNGKPMQDWKRAVITWEPNNKERVFGQTTDRGRELKCGRDINDDY